MASPLLRPFRPSDLESLVCRDGEHGLSRNVVAQAAAGIALTAEVDGVPIGCGGLIVPWEGCGMCWMLLGESICRYPVWLTRTVRHLLTEAEQDYRLHRLEAIALIDSGRNQHWLELLGFTTEKDGCARAYLPAKLSVVRYERVKGA